MTTWFVPHDELKALLADILSEHRTYGVRAEEDQLRIRPMGPTEVWLPPHRALDPLKSFFFRPRENLGGYFGEEAEPEPLPRAIIGACACDLAALQVLDWVFLEGDVADPYYKAQRENTILVSVDCREPADVCFCTFCGGKPYPEEGFDLHLSPLESGCILEAGSQRGEALLQGVGRQLEEASAQQLSERDQIRADAKARVNANLERVKLEIPPDLRKSVRDSRDNPVWEQIAEKCVECGACNFICPTCHCFLLVDLQEKAGFRRFKNWDACLYRGFAVEASGANPRPRRANRLHGRLEKKFDFIPANADLWGCVGCGRCVEACPGEIDMRETLRELVNA